MSCQSRIINNFINFNMVTFILILTIKSASCDSELTNLTEISQESLSNLSSAKSWFNNLSKSHVSGSRTFGVGIRKLQMALLPILFKFGVMSALISVLVFLAIKTVFLLKVLLFLNLGVLLIKLVGWKPQHYEPQPHLYGYNPHELNSWIPPHQQYHDWNKAHSDNKEVHLHIHNDGRTSEKDHAQSWNKNSDNEPYIVYPNRNNKRQINSDFQNYGPAIVSESYRNVDGGKHVSTLSQ